MHSPDDPGFEHCAQAHNVACLVESVLCKCSCALMMMCGCVSSEKYLTVC